MGGCVDVPSYLVTLNSLTSVSVQKQVFQFSVR